MSQGTTSPSKQLQFLDGLVDLVIMAIRETSDHSFDRRMQRFLYFFFFFRGGGGGGGIHCETTKTPSFNENFPGYWILLHGNKMKPKACQLQLLCNANKNS